MLVTTDPVVGRLYTCEEYCLIICKTSMDAYPTRGVTMASHDAALEARLIGAQYCERAVPLLILSTDSNGCFEVLAGDKSGWVKRPNWLQLKELSSGI